MTIKESSKEGKNSTLRLGRTGVWRIGASTWILNRYQNKKENKMEKPLLISDRHNKTIRNFRIKGAGVIQSV